MAETKLKPQSIDTTIATTLGAWTAYTPSLTNITLGNGTLAFYYTQIGKIVFVKGTFNMGSTSSISGNMTFSLPVTANSNAIYQTFQATILDQGTAWVDGVIKIESTTTISVSGRTTNATYGTLPGTSSTVPMTWANTDFVTFYIFYEAA